MLRRLIAGSLVAALAIGTIAAVVSADEPGGVKGGGSVLAANTGVHGAVGIHVKISGRDVTGQVNVNLFAPVAGQRVQHFIGDVTGILIRPNGVVYICGDVKLLQLGTNTNEGRHFEMVVDDNGQPGEGSDFVTWYRQGSPTDCGDDSPSANRKLIDGNVKVVD